MTIHRPASRILYMAATAVAVSLALSACENQNAKRQQQIKAKMKDLRPTVSVLTVYPQDIVLETDLSGRLESIRNTDIMAQTSGVVKRRLFEEGTAVRAGQPLYELDDSASRAALQSAQAGLLGAQAALEKARADVARYRPLVQADAISKQEWDAAQAAERAAAAQVKSAEAAINSAEVSLRYAHITAPISGHIGQSLVSEGSLVTANSTKLANIRQNDPLYLNITQSSADMLRLRQQLRSGQAYLNNDIAITLELEDGSTYAHQGRLLFADTHVDKATGQITLRAVIPNPELLLVSGMYVRAKLPLSKMTDVFAIPQQAVSRGQTDTVTLVGQDGKMEQRTIKIVGQQGNYWVVSEGLNAGEKVVMDGTMIAGMMNAKQVQIKEWQPENGAALPAPASPAAASEAASQPAASAVSAPQ